jgi:hypothetical protein
MTASRLTILGCRDRFSSGRRTEDALVVTELNRTVSGTSPEGPKLPLPDGSVAVGDRQSATMQANMTQDRYVDAAFCMAISLQAFKPPVDGYFHFSPPAGTTTPPELPPPWLRQGTPLQSLAPERTYYLTNLSKVVAPGLRVGYLVVPSRSFCPNLQPPLEALRICFGAPPGDADVALGVEILAQLAAEAPCRSIPPLNYSQYMPTTNIGA